MDTVSSIYPPPHMSLSIGSGGADALDTIYYLVYDLCGVQFIPVVVYFRMAEGLVHDLVVCCNNSI